MTLGCAQRSEVRSGSDPGPDGPQMRLPLYPPEADIVSQTDRVSRAGATVLSRVAQIGDDRSQPASISSSTCVGQQEELYEVLVDGRAQGLHDIGVTTANSGVDGDVQLSVGEPPRPDIGKVHSECSGYPLRKRRMRGSTDDRQITHENTPRLRAQLGFANRAT